MATSTPNYGLYKYEGNDAPDLTKLSTSMDKIDTELKKHETNIGSIPERGSNANGEYAKFPSGLLICWVRMTPSNKGITGAYAPNFFLGDQRWDFPHVFLGSPTVTCSEFRVGNSMSFGFVSSSDFEWSQLRAYSPLSVPAGSAVITAMAVGRWK